MTQIKEIWNQLYFTPLKYKASAQLFSQNSQEKHPWMTQKFSSLSLQAFQKMKEF